MLFDFTRPGGRVETTVARDGVEIDVRDASGQPLQPTGITRDAAGATLITAVR